MSDRRPRFNLIDLVLLVILVGLFGAFAHSVSLPVLLAGGGPGPVLICLIGIVVWIPVWMVSRAPRSDRTRTMPVSDSRPRINLIDLVLVVVLVALIGGFVRVVGMPGQAHAAGIIGGGLGLWFVVWKISRTRRTGPVCADCGRRFAPDLMSVANSPVCQRCLPRSLTPSRARRERAKGFWALGYLFVMATVVVGLFLALPVGGVPFGPADWFTVSLMAVGRVLVGGGCLSSLSW